MSTKKVIVRATLLSACLVMQMGLIGCAMDADGVNQPQVTVVAEREVHVAFTEGQIDEALFDAEKRGGKAVLVAPGTSVKGMDVTHIEFSAGVETLRAAKAAFERRNSDYVTFVVPIERIVETTVLGGFSDEDGDVCMYNKQIAE